MHETIRDDQVELLLNDLLDVHGYDFTDYSKASLKRRITRLMKIDKFPSFAEFRYRVKNDQDYLQRFVEEITVNVTEMFRDPGFYQTLRTDIIPVLATYPLIRIWHAGCATGEEVYSMAILLSEANLLQKSLIYATDINPGVVQKAKSGIFSLQQMKQYSENYILSGGRKDFSSYYAARYDLAIFNKELGKRMIFATHNLVSDHSFNTFQLILCRNVLIYFDRDLQDRVLTTFDKSLDVLGYIALGAKETINYSPISHKYQRHKNEKIWRKIH